MNQREREQVGAALCELSLATGGPEVDAPRIAVYLKNLDSEPAEAVLAAIAGLMRKATFFPSVGQIIEAITGNDQAKALEAWTRAVAIVSRGQRTSADLVLNQAVRMIGGWEVIALTPTEKLPFVERRFCEVFPSVEAKAATGAAIEAGKVRAIR